MSIQSAKDKLEALRKKIRDDLEGVEELESNLPEDSAADVLGPRDELEKQRVKQDLEDSDEDGK